MQQYLSLIIPPAVILTLALWHSGAIQRTFNRASLRLPQWAQPIPPILLSMVAAVVVALVDGRAPDAEDTGTIGLITVGLYHVAKRWISNPIIETVRKASLNSLVFSSFILFACSGQSLPQPTMVCPIPSQYLAALPTPAEVANAVDKGKTVAQQVEAVTEDPTVSGLVVVAGTVLDALDSVAPICAELASAPCDDAIAQSREILASGEARRKEVCQVVALLVAVVPVERVTAELVAAQEMCR